VLINVDPATWCTAKSLELAYYDHFNLDSAAFSTNDSSWLVCVHIVNAVILEYQWNSTFICKPHAHVRSSGPVGVDLPVTIKHVNSLQ